MPAASAPGKLILFGEHAVVFGEPALAMAVDLRTEVYVRPGPETTVNGLPIASPRFRYVRAAAKRGGASDPLTFEIRSMIPSAAGMGSSAAVTVATLAALRALRREEPPPETLARLAFEVEHEVQGRASPIDTSTSVHGNGVLIRRERGDGFLWQVERGDRKWFLHHVDVPAFRLVVGETGVGAATGPLVAKVKQFADQSADARAAIEEIGRIALEGAEALGLGRWERVGELMVRNHELLNFLGVGHPLLDRLVRVARRWSYGAKLTGAGGGGSMIALTDEADRVCQAIEQEGGRAFVVHPDPQGVEVRP